MIIPDYWKGEEFASLKEYRTIEYLAAIAAEVVCRMPFPVIEVCGPLTTGGLGSFEANMRVYLAVSDGLRKQGKHVFDVRPFEPSIQLYHAEWNKSSDDYCWPIMDVFYRTIFDTGRIGLACFIPGWESSRGARWERNYFKSHGVQIQDLTSEEVVRYLRANKT